MKELHYHDPYSKSNVKRIGGFKTDNGIIRVIPNYDKNGLLKYLTLRNNNDGTLHISATLIPEVIEMLKKYSLA